MHMYFFPNPDFFRKKHKDLPKPQALKVGAFDSKTGLPRMSPFDVDVVDGERVGVFQRNGGTLKTEVLMFFFVNVWNILLNIYIYKTQKVQFDQTLPIGRIGNPFLMDHPKDNSLFCLGVFFVSWFGEVKG